MQAPSIPTVDLEDIASSDPERRQRAADSVREGFGVFGLVYVKSHGVDMDVLSVLYDRFSELCRRSESDKQPLNRGDLWFQRGYTPPNTEQAVVSTGQPDFKECYFAAPLPTDPECQIEYPQIYADNVWPNGIELAEPYLKLGAQLQSAGTALLQAAALALDLTADTFTSRIEGGPHVTRLLRYLPLTTEQIESGVVWGEEHTDFNVLTLLPGGRFQDATDRPCAPPDGGSGLYLRARPDSEHPRGRKVQGTAPAGCLVAQVGQALEILTGGAFLATPHVITAPKTPGFSRLSAAHFVHMHSHQLLFPLEKLRTPEVIAAYSPPVLAGTYAIKTLVDIHLAPPEALDRLGYRHYDRLNVLRALDED